MKKVILAAVFVIAALLGSFAVASQASATSSAKAYNNSGYSNAIQARDRYWAYWRTIPAYSWASAAGISDVWIIHINTGYCAKRSILQSDGWWSGESGEMRGPVDSGVAAGTVTSWRVYRC